MEVYLRESLPFSTCNVLIILEFHMQSNLGCQKVNIIDYAHHHTRSTLVKNQHLLQAFFFEDLSSHYPAWLPRLLYQQVMVHTTQTTRILVFG